MSKLVKSALLASAIFLASSLVLADNHQGKKRPGQDGAGTKPRHLDDKMESKDGGNEEVGGKAGEERMPAKVESSKKTKGDRRESRSNFVDESGASEETDFTTYP